MAETKTKKTTRKTKTTSSANDLTENLDLTVAKPKPTTHLSLHNHYGAQFADGCWMLEPGGAMQFRLQVAEPEHMIFALEMHSSLDAWIEKLARRMSDSKTPVLEWLRYTPDSYNPAMLSKLAKIK